MSSSLIELNDARRRRDTDTNKILTAGGQSIVSHLDSSWKIVNQMRALKEHLGLGSVLGTIAIVIAIGAPAVKQGEINGTTTRAVEALTKEQAVNQAANEKALSDAVMRMNESATRIEAGVRAAVDLSQQSLNETRALRTSTDNALGQIRQETMGLWKWSTDIGARVGQLESEIKKRSKE